MRIAVNALPLLAVRTGIARYLTNLCGCMAEEGAEILYIRPGHVGAVPPAPAHQGGLLDRVLSLPPGFVYAMRAVQWIAYERYARGVAKRMAIDVFHESFYSPADIGHRASQVFTLHDLSLLTFAHTHSRDRRLFFQRFFQARLDHADRIIVPSTFVKEELCERFPMVGNRVAMIPEGVDARFSPRDRDAVAAILRRLGIESEYLLFVGTLEPRKNLATLLRALAVCRADLPLVLVGWSGWGDPEFRNELDRHDLRCRVLTPGYVDDEDLAGLYSGATAFLYPSLYEGFGLPVLEAMACGCPVVCSRAASIPEVAGKSALLADPLQPEEWAEAIDSVVHDADVRRRLVSDGKQRAAQFSWEAAARKTLRLYSSLL